MFHPRVREVVGQVPRDTRHLGERKRPRPRCNLRPPIAAPAGGNQFGQFDVFLGMGTESIIPEASWFPIVLEIKNDGAPFVGFGAGILTSFERS